MKRILKRFIYKLNKNPISKSFYKNEAAKRSQLPFTAVETLSKHINMFAPYTNELSPINDWYGHAKNLKKFLGLSETYQFKFIIEHGLYFSTQIADIELESDLPTFVTYSPFRVKVLKKVRPFAFGIGPFIHYAKHYLSDIQLKKEKKRLGKTLLFFPSHSLIGLKASYDMDWQYKKIKTISKDFNTVRVCIYWKDVLLGIHKYYQSKGFECVTAGHILDPLFLPRLKSILETADLTISNDASSPLSYSIFMNKPHIIFYQRPKMEGRRYLKKVTTDYWQSKPYHKVLKEFSKIQYKITPRQRELINYYCGAKDIKSKKELLGIVEESEKIYKTYKPG